MNTIYLDVKLNTIFFDKSKTPKWSNKVKRWNQLDAESFCLAEATYRNPVMLAPDLVVLVAAESSLSTDRLFTASGKISPSLFVHTLPNVRLLSYSLLSGWEGEMLCLSSAEKSLTNSLNQFCSMFENSSYKKILFINVCKKSANEYSCDFYELNKSVLGKYKIEMKDCHEQMSLEAGVDDLNFRDQIVNNLEELTLSKLVQVRKIS